MMDLEDAVVEWLSGERHGQHRHLLIEDIMRLAKHSDVWPVAERYMWERAVTSCLASGAIAEKSGRLVVARKPTKPTQKDSQMDLFD